MTREERFGKEIRAQREARGLSLRKAAARIGVSHMRLSELESGVSRTTYHPTRPSPELVGRIASVYELPTDALLELAGHAREQPELTYEEGLMLSLFRQLDSHHRDLAIKVVATIKNSQAGSTET